ncbi:MAG: dephospho-CoA kinase [Anaerolineae bacterium]|nr:dephospho-CoA kinase [Anaerolineae bacterium]
MSKWVGKYAIGLTGNIGTGKSIVRRMLEHLGAYGIDADALSRRATAKGAPGYEPVIKMFGRWLLNEEGEIDRSRLATLVFNHPAALTELEKIVHPLVRQAVDYYARRSSHNVIVIEAIKLIETGMFKEYDSLWVTSVSPSVQITRLVKDRKMNEADARQRIAAQSSQEQKIALANVVIDNNGSFTQTWQQVSAAWEKISPKTGMATTALSPLGSGEIKILRGKPRHSLEIANLINRLSKNGPNLSADDIMGAFGEKAFFLLYIDYKMAGVIGWQVENLVTRVLDLHFDESVNLVEVLPLLINEIEQASADLQAEAALLSFPPDYRVETNIWQKLGYKQVQPADLTVAAWHEAAQEINSADGVIYFKQLRQDRVLKPI